MEDVKNRSKGSMKFKIDFVNKMIDLVKEASQYQFEINKMLNPYYAMANSVKTKGKKFLNENMKSYSSVVRFREFITNKVRHQIQSDEDP